MSGAVSDRGNARQRHITFEHELALNEMYPVESGIASESTVRSWRLLREGEATAVNMMEVWPV